MRIVLVILFFVGLHLALHPSSTVTVLESALQIARPGEPSGVNDAAAMPAAAEVTMPHFVPVLPARASAAALPAETLSLLPDTAGPVSAVEPANVQHTAAQIAPPAVDSHADVARLVQKELSRLACLTGYSERKWGKKSRAALRRFTDRAKPNEAGEPDAALLEMLRRYPENYCKLCRPGRVACAIEATRSLPQRSRTESEKHAPDNASYLPPWMRGNKVAKAEEGVQSDATEPAVLPAPEVKKPRRSRNAKRGARSRATAHRAWNWPALNGWPKGR